MIVMNFFLLWNKCNTVSDILVIKKAGFAYYHAL